MSSDELGSNWEDHKERNPQNLLFNIIIEAISLHRQLNHDENAGVLNPGGNAAPLSCYDEKLGDIYWLTQT